MSAGWVLVQTHQGAGPRVADTLATIPGVELAEHTGGAYDVVARVVTDGDDDRGVRRLVAATLRVPGVTLAVCCQPGAPPLEIDLANAAEVTEPSDGVAVS